MAAPTFNYIRDAIYDWASALVAPLSVIWAYQNTPRPPLPYLTLHINPAAQVAQDYTYSPGTTGISLICGNREFTVMLQHFGVGGYDTMEKLGSSLEAFTVQQTFSAAGLAIIRRLPTLSIPALLDTRYEERYAMDIQFRTYSEYLDDVGLISNAEIRARFMQENRLTLEQTLRINS